MVMLLKMFYYYFCYLTQEYAHNGNEHLKQVMGCKAANLSFRVEGSGLVSVGKSLICREKMREGVKQQRAMSGTTY